MLRLDVPLWLIENPMITTPSLSHKRVALVIGSGGAKCAAAQLPYLQRLLAAE